MSPFDCEITPNVESNLEEVANSIYNGNKKLIERCDVVLANVEPFRGPSLDVGTAFEIGMAVAMGKPVYAYNVPITQYKYRANGNGFNIEDFKLFDNLMIACSVIILNFNVYGALAEIAEIEKSKNNNMLSGIS